MNGQTKTKRMTRRGSALLCIAALAVALPACGGSHDHSAGQVDPKFGNSTDAAFVAAMIPHHQSAVDMAKLAQTRAEHPQVKALAANILATQTTEIQTMKALQASLPKVSGHDAHMGMSDKDMGMDGDMGSLAGAKPFDKAFLEMMIPHHQGAVRMAEMEIAKGKNPQLKDLSRRIVSSQNAEIKQMRSWLEDWYGVTSSSDAAHMGGSSGMTHG